MIETDWDKILLFDLKCCGVNPYTLNGWGVGIFSNPRFSHSLDNIVLIQLSLSTITL